MNKEEFCNRIEQAIANDIKRSSDGIDEMADIMENMPAIPFKDMEPLFRISLRYLWFLERMIILYYQPELAMEHIVMMKQLYELGKTRGYGPMNAILATSPFFFLDKVIFILLV